MNPSTTMSPNWQDSLDHRLMQRLLHHVNQPGILKAQFSQAILKRTARFAEHLAFSQQLARRYRNGETATNNIPIVYAQPLLFSNSNDASSPSTVPPTPSSERTVIQAKWITTNPLPSNSLIQPILQNNPTTTITTTASATASSAALSPHSNSSETYVLQTIIEQGDTTFSTNPFFTAQQPSVANPPLLETVQIPLVYAHPRSLDDITDRDRPSSLPTVTPILSTPPQTLKANSSSAPIVQAQSLQALQSQAQSLQPSLLPRQDLPVTELPLAAQRRSASIAHVAPEITSDLSVTKGDRAVRPTVQPTVRPMVKPTVQPIIPSSNRPAIPGKWSGTEVSLIYSNSSSNSKSNSEMGTNSGSPELLNNNGLNDRSNAIVSYSNGHAKSFPTATNSDGQPPTLPVNIVQPSSTEPSVKLDVDAIADKVERKLMRRLMVERERRGQPTWR